MRTKKRRFEQFIFYDYNGIARHLEKMARDGWLLSKISGNFWTYERIEPSDLHFTVTYFSEASEFNPYPTENQQVFLDYCEEAGWKLVTEWAQMQILYSDREDPIPIETDEAVKLQAIHKSMKKNFIPSSAMMVFVSILQMVAQSLGLWTDPIDWLSDITRQLLLICWVLIGIGNVVVLSGYFRWKKRSERAVADGGDCVTSVGIYRKISSELNIAALFGVLGWMIFAVSGGMGWIAIVMVAVLLLLVYVIENIKDEFKKQGMSRTKNYVLTVTMCVVGTIGVMIWMIHMIFRGMDAGWYGRQPAEEYRVTMSNGNVWVWDIYHDELPLTIEELIETDHEHYSYELEEKQSLLLAWTRGRQNAPPDGEESYSMEYEIVDVKFQSLYDLCLEELMETYGDSDDLPYEYRTYWKEIDADVWGADKAYQWYQGDDTPYNDFVICWGDRIVRLDVDWDLYMGDDQIRTVAEKLGK
ncbi:MAG: DUF2812 domain-containing protein [Lachnospiraceae bacterium]|nr:DUF2812 domain-containing protein [Lachnospiraceae bacterium]